MTSHSEAMTSGEKLLPCRCGNAAEFRRLSGLGLGVMRYKCAGVTCQASTGWFADLAEAQDAWNAAMHRPTPAGAWNDAIEAANHAIEQERVKILGDGYDYKSGEEFGLAWAQKLIRALRRPAPAVAGDYVLHAMLAAAPAQPEAPVQDAGLYRVTPERAEKIIAAGELPIEINRLKEGAKQCRLNGQAEEDKGDKAAWQQTGSLLDRAATFLSALARRPGSAQEK